MKYGQSPIKPIRVAILVLSKQPLRFFELVQWTNELAVENAKKARRP
jgi:hypothetical protein